MARFNHMKYKAFNSINLPSRRWPDRILDHAPTWCSVDLRDGNQALVEPMTARQKLILWDQLVAIGFKEIEVGFPSASTPDFDFVRQLIEEGRVPDDVTIQVLTQARPELIKRTFEALIGVKSAILAIYNSTSTVQREQVFDLDRDGIIEIAVDGATLVRDCAAEHEETEWVFEYSPESFTGTELDFALDICNAVVDVWNPSPQKKCIINLPATVEMSTPNVYADQIEWFCDRVDRRDSLIISLHTHNDRGCAVAAGELGVMAGADRVEGTLMGNGERTGNMDIITMAMNLYSQGVNPNLDLSRMDEIIETVKSCTQLPIHPRHPYAGELVFTAFSGSHQDAIKKCLSKRDDAEPWQVAYLPIDPADIGRTYEEVIRINSQSGKGGIAYVLERDFGLTLPRWLQIDFSAGVQAFAEAEESEVEPSKIYELFQQTYFPSSCRWALGDYQVKRVGAADFLDVAISVSGGGRHTLSGSGNGVMAAFVDAMQKFLGQKIVLVEYSEHALSRSVDAEAICYIQLSIEGERHCGIGRSTDIVQASLDGILGAINSAAEKNAMSAA